MGKPTDISLAKSRLVGTTTLSIVREGSVIFESAESGIKPLILAIGSGKSFRGASAADTIVGKAAAMLFLLMGVAEIYGKIGSDSAESYLEETSISFFFSEKVPAILNRKGDGPCPFEMMAGASENPEELLQKAKAFLKI
jgi:hypothetical protein